MRALCKTANTADHSDLDVCVWQWCDGHTSLGDNIAAREGATSGGHAGTPAVAITAQTPQTTSPQLTHHWEVTPQTRKRFNCGVEHQAYGFTICVVVLGVIIDKWQCHPYLNKYHNTINMTKTATSITYTFMDLLQQWSC